MVISFSFYGWLGESKGNLGVPSSVSVPDGTTTGELLERLADDYSDLDVLSLNKGLERNEFVLLLNGRYVHGSEKTGLADGDHITIVRVFSGG